MTDRISGNVDTFRVQFLQKSVGIITAYTKDMLVASGLAFLLISVILPNSVWWYFTLGLMAMPVVSWIAFFVVMVLHKHDVKILESIMVKK